MLGLVMASFFVRQIKDRIVIFCIACIVVLFVLPDSIFSYAFHYSFLAVLALVLCRPSGFIMASVCVFLFLIPLNLHSSGSMNIFHIFSNAVAIPVFSFLYFPFQLLMLIFTYFDQQWAVTLMDLSTGAFVWLIKLLSLFCKQSVLKLNSINLFECLYLYSLLAASMGIFKKGFSLDRTKGFVIYSVAFLLSSLFIVYYYNYMSGDRIFNIDLDRAKKINGSGDVVLGMIGNKVFVIDTGPGGGSTSKALKKISIKKVKEVDYLILSHGDLDHIGGLSQLLSSLNVKRIVTTPFMAGKISRLKLSSELYVACSGSGFVLGEGYSVKFHTPRDCITSSKKELAFSIRNQYYDVNFMSDLRPPYSKTLLSELSRTKSRFSILQVPHHCSSKDNDVNFLNQRGFDLGFCTRHKSLLKSGIDNRGLDFPVFITGVCGDMELALGKGEASVISKKCPNLLLRTSWP